MPELILMPALSDTMEAGFIVSWHKKVGDSVKPDDVLAEVETDQAYLEVLSYVTGTLLHIGGNEGEMISVNGLICVIGDPGDDISKFVSPSLNHPMPISKFEDKSVMLENTSQQAIFFSYSKNDSEFVLKLVNDIQKNGQKIWIDVFDIKAGQPWHKEIQNALKNAKSILVILSQSSVDSENVLNEIYYALQQRKNIIPIIINECELPYGLHRLHYIDFKANYDKSLRQLLNTIMAIK